MIFTGFLTGLRLFPRNRHGKRTRRGRCNGGCRAGCFVMVLIFSILPPPAVACPLELPTAVVSINNKELLVELAFTPDTRSCGLSNRLSLGDGRGMLFLFPNAAKRTFWMKDTHIPLSIAFIDDGGLIVTIHQMEADQTRTTYPSFQPVRYALEVKRGWFDLYGIKIGDRVKMTFPAVLNIQ